MVGFAFSQFRFRIPFAPTVSFPSSSSYSSALALVLLFLLAQSHFSLNVNASSLNLAQEERRGSVSNDSISFSPRNFSSSSPHHQSLNNERKKTDDNTTLCLLGLVSLFNVSNLYNVTQMNPNQEQMLMSWGKGPADLGKYYECQSVENAHYCVITTWGAPDLGFSVGESYTGVCVPSICRENEIFNDSVSQFILNRLFLNTSAFNVQLIGAHCPEPVALRSTGSVLTVVLFSLFFFFVVSATLYYFFKEDSKSLNSEKQPLLMGEKKKESLISTFLLCFSVPINWNLLTLQPRQGNGFRSLDGLRVLSMCWIILGHTLYYMFANSDSYIYALRQVQTRFTFQLVSNSLYAVDTFFFLSGFLALHLSLKFFRDHTPPRGLKFISWTIKVITQRYLRLTPLYATILLFYIYIVPSLSEGPVWDQYLSLKYAEKCKTYWWTNLLYVNNMYPHEFDGDKEEPGCMGWTWYLANDMQMFLVVPFLAWLAYYYNKLFFGAVFMGISGCIMANGLVVHIYHLVACQAYSTDVEGVGEYKTVVYNKPYMRMTPYLLGVLLAGVFDYLGGERRVSSRTAPRLALRVFVNLLIAFFLITPVYVTYWMRDHDGSDAGTCDWTHATQSFFLAVNRFMWSLGIFILVASTLFGWEGWVVSILSQKLWVPLGKLVYAVFVLHPILISVILWGGNRPIDYTDMQAGAYFIAFVVMSFCSALVLFFLFEAPLHNIIRLIFPNAR